MLRGPSPRAGWAYQGLDAAGAESFGTRGPEGEQGAPGSGVPDGGEAVRRSLAGAWARRRARKRRRRGRRAVVWLGVCALLAAPMVALTEEVGDGGDGAGSPELVGLALEDVPYAGIFQQTGRLGVDPRLVTAVAFVESGLDEAVATCEAPGPSGGKGIMQISEGRAAEMGIDPCKPEAAIFLVGSLLAASYEHFDAWELAVAAFKVGPQAVEQAGGVPAEVQGYVGQVMAKWQEYQAVDAVPAQPAAGGPVSAKGSTARYTEPGLPAVTQRMLDEIIPKFGRGPDVFCFGKRSGRSDHPSGHACDFMMAPRTGIMPTAEYTDHGNALAAYLIANADRLDVKYIIWRGSIWQDGRWKDYTVYDGRGNLTEEHFDHVHLSLYGG